MGIFKKFGKAFFLRFWNDDRGQSTTEYILILSVVVLVAMRFKDTFQKKLTGIVDKLGTEIDKGVDSN